MSKRDANPFHPRYLGSWVALGLLRLLSFIPMPVLYRLGSGLGDLLRVMIPSRRRVAERNLALCFPDRSRESIRALVKENFRNTARMGLLTGFVWWASREKLLKFVTVRNLDLFEDALACGPGVVLLAPHFITLELGGIFLSLDFPGVSVYQYNRNPVFDRAMLKARQRFGGKLFERKSDLRQMVKSIRKGEFCYYLPDQDPGPRRAIFAPFFGVPTATWPVLGRLARMSPAPTLACATYLQPDGRGFEIIFSGPLPGFPTGDDQADATTMNKAIEDCVNHEPTQYFWVHKRFKTRPPGAPPVYKT